MVAGKSGFSVRKHTMIGAMAIAGHLSDRHMAAGTDDYTPRLAHRLCCACDVLYLSCNDMNILHLSCDDMNISHMSCDDMHVSHMSLPSMCIVDTRSAR